MEITFYPVLKIARSAKIFEKLGYKVWYNALQLVPKLLNIKIIVYF